MNKLLLICLASVVLSCATQSSDVEKSPAGVEIKYMERGNGENLVLNNVLLIATKYGPKGGGIMASSSQERPLALYNGENKVEEGGLLKDVISHLNLGDSVYFEIPAHDLFSVSFGIPIPDSIGAEEMIAFNMKVFEQMTEEMYRAYIKDLEFKANAKKFEEELENLDQYLSDNNIKTVADPSGLKYQITEKRNGIDPEKNDQVTVKYVGSTLDGKVFDQGTYSFKLGNGEVIDGWDLGVSLMGLGDKGVLYIPSQMAYGARGSGVRIPPFATLKFEVELVDIKK